MRRRLDGYAEEFFEQQAAKLFPVRLGRHTIFQGLRHGPVAVDVFGILQLVAGQDGHNVGPAVDHPRPDQLADSGDGGGRGHAGVESAGKQAQQPPAPRAPVT